MIAVLAAIALFVIVGFPITLAVDGTTRGTIRLGLAIFYGSGAVMFALMLLSFLHIRWTPLSALIALFAFAGVALMVRKRSAPRESRGVQKISPHLLDGATAVMLASYAAYVSVASPVEWDFWINWGLKARVFLEHGGIDWRWLESRFNDFSHPDYPLLVPLNYAFPGLLQGGWNDRWMGVLFVPWAIAVLLVARTLTAEEAPNWVSAAATLASAPVSMTRYVGLAEGALIAFAGAALLFLRRAVAKDGAIDWRHGALLLGLAANCKNEGLALIVAAAAGIVLADLHRWRRVLRLWPAIMVAAPWLLMRTAHALPTDIVTGNAMGRGLQRLANPGGVFFALDKLLFDRWSWIAILATLLIVPAAIARERFILILAAVQMGIYVAAYFVTPNELAWHVATSWDRLTRQLQLPLTVVSVILLAPVVAGDHARMRTAMS